MNILSLFKNDFVIMFLIAALGYLLGRIRFRGLSLGTSGVLIVALAFGHFGLQVPAVIRNFGLILFVAAVGYIAGPVFFRLFKQKAAAYIIMGLSIVLAGALATFGIIRLFQVPADLAVGMFVGALTSTPGLAAATEVLGDAAATGYGIAYPFGVVGVVLFVQLVPKLVRADMAAEADKLLLPGVEDTRENRPGSFVVESSGFFGLAAAVVLGMLLANLVIPLPGGIRFSLGTSGGPLLTGLAFGHFGRVGKLSLHCPTQMLETCRELGLVLFLMGAGTQAGVGFVEILAQYGAKLFLLGAVITVLPMLLGYFLGQTVFKLSLLNILGSITGGMTSTPALGALVTVSGSNNAAAAYAATYPVALIAVVVCTQLLGLFLGG